ncbi:hypothetical protein Pla175_25690 [Pirellulimonas nuda]|uniref:Bacterial type II and III secretion system protein n=1 Tax=Pirellulimonas nuda TaxID=2528009 RepID=A0A518DCG5_9BACT|nr:hypothetical protein [Pirellulimonas nuda]QDU89182.1 hypothetical protein Pla175_25690 [Pirellulimonas nuda]
MFARPFAVLLMTFATASAQESPLVLRTYPIGDVVLEVSDYPYEGSTTSGRSTGGLGGGGFMGGGGGGYAGGAGGAVSAPGPHQPANPAITIDAIIEAMTGAIEPESWAVNGEGDASVAVLGRMLVVSQTQDVHQQIESFLQLVRQNAEGRRTVGIDARWLMLTSDDLAKLTDQEQGAGPLLVNKAPLEEFTRRSTSRRAITNCFSGQLVHVVSGTRKNVVTGFIPVVGDLADPGVAGRLAQAAPRRSPFRTVQFSSGQGVSDSGFAEAPSSNVGYQPLVQSEVFGVVLEIRPTTIAENQDEVIVDLSSTLKSQASSEPAGPPALAARSLAPQIDRVEVNTAHLATTFIMPLGKPVLVGGLSYLPDSSVAAGEALQADPSSQETPQAYLVLEVR